MSLPTSVWAVSSKSISRTRFLSRWNSTCLRSISRISVPPWMAGMVKVGIEYGTSFFTGFAGNVSRGGLFVATHQTIPVGARVELFFEMPDGHSVAAPAQVRWVRDIEQANMDGSAPGIGLAFVNLTHDDAIVLERYVATHAASVLYDEGAALP